MRGIRLLAALIQADIYRSGAFGPSGARGAAVVHVALAAFAMGALGCAVGFVGWRWLAGEADHDPLLEILLGGLLGFLGGLAWALKRERGRASTRHSA